MSRDLAKKHGFTIYDTIDEALTLGGKELAVDGVLCIGEHGKYPTNDKGQILYPRRRFFEEVTNVFAKHEEGRAGVQRQAPGRHLGRRQVDVRPGPRADGPVHGRLVGAGDLAASRS